MVAPVDTSQLKFEEEVDKVKKLLEVAKGFKNKQERDYFVTHIAGMLLRLAGREFEIRDYNSEHFGNGGEVMIKGQDNDDY